MPCRILSICLLLVAPTLWSADKPISTLREAANQAFAKKHWTTPADGCANQLANEILSRIPDDAGALALKNHMVVAYQELAKQAEEAGSAKKAHSYLKRALQVSPENKTLLQAADVLKESLRQQRVKTKDNMIDAFNRIERDPSREAWLQFVEDYPESEFVDYARNQYKLANRGSLRVTIQQGAGPANVLLDGKPVGETPLELLELDAGEHMLSVQRPYHQSHEQVVTISADTPVEVNAQLILADPIFSAEVIHHHRMSSGCYGTLGLHSDRLEFKAKDGKHSSIILWRYVGLLDTTHPRTFKVTNIRNLKRYRYDLQKKSIDGDLAIVLDDLWLKQKK